MREIEQDLHNLRRIDREISRGLSLQSTAERMGGFGFVTLDLETGDYWLSEGVCKIAGVRRLSALAKKPQKDIWADHVHPDDLPAMHAGMAEAVESGAEVEVFYRLVRLDGDVRHVHSTVQVVDASGGHLATLLAAIVDVAPSA